jgi:hypothetical protein
MFPSRSSAAMFFASLLGGTAVFMRLSAKAYRFPICHWLTWGSVFVVITGS